MPRLNREEVDVTSSLKNILDNYPAGSATLREFLQNTDDAGAKTQVFILDTRTFGSTSLVGCELDVCQGPAIIATNNAYFKKKDWKAITTILNSSKTQDETSTGKYGLGFRSCYHITDNPHILSHDNLLILDPHARVEKFPGGFDLSTRRKPNDEGKIERDVYEDHFATFRSVLGPEDDFYPGTAIRLPLRLPGFESKLKSTPTEVADARKMFKEFVAKELPEAMLFLKNIREIKLIEIDLKGAETVLATATLEKFDVAGPQPSEGRVKRDQTSHHRVTVTLQIGSALPVARSWIITHFVEKYESASGHMARRLKRLPSHVEKDMSEDKLFPRVALAFPISQGVTTAPDPNGRLFTLLPLPIMTNFPVHISAVLALVSSRQNLRNSTDVEAGSREEFLVEWNRAIFSEFVPKAWAALLDHLVTQQSADSSSAPCPTINVFEAWPGPVASQDGDQGYWYPLPSRLLEEAARKAVWPLRGKRSQLSTLSDVLVAAEEENVAPLAALEACNVPLVIIPQRVFNLIQMSEFNKAILTPETAYPYIKKNSRTVSDLDAATRRSICDWLVSANDIRLILNLPIIPQVQNKHTSITSYDKYTMAAESEAAIFSTVDQNLLAGASMSAATRQLLLSNSAGRVRPVGPAEVARYLESQVPTSTLANISGVKPATFNWLIEFWSWLDGWEKLDELVDDTPAWSTIQDLHALPLRLSSGGLALRLVEKSAVRSGGLDAEVVAALTALEVPMLESSMSTGSAVQHVSKSHSDVVFILQGLRKNKSFAHLNQASRQTLHEFFTQQLSNHLRPAGRACQRETLSVESRNALRTLPIFPIFNPGRRDGNSTTFDVAPEGACFVDNSVQVIPSIRGAPFVSHDQGRILHTALEERCVLGEVDVLRKAISPEAWSQQDRVAGLLSALIDRLINRLNELGAATRSTVGELPIVEVGGRRQSPNQVVDPSSGLAGLYDAEDEVLPVGQFAREDAGSYISQLRNCGMILTTLTPAAIKERVDRIANQSRPMKDRAEKALRLLKLLESYTQPGEQILPPETIEVLVSSAWLPVADKFYTPSECWDSRPNDAILCDLVLPRISVTVNTQDLRHCLGWTRVPFAILQTQLIESLKTNADSSETPQTDALDRIEAVLKELASEFQAGRVFQEDIGSLAEALEDYAWVTTNSRNRCASRQAMLGQIDFGMRYYPVAPYLLRFPGMEALLRQMGIPDRPSQVSLLSTLRDISQELSETDITGPTRDGLVHTSILILNELSQAMDGNEFELEKTLIPTDTCQLAPALQVLFNDVGGDPPCPAIGLQFAHSQVSASLANAIGLRRLSEVDFYQGEDDIQSFSMAEDLIVQIRGVLQDYDIDHSSNEWVANAEDAGASSVTFLVDEASFQGRRVIGGLTSFQSGPALVVHNDGVLKDVDFDGLGNIGQGGKSGRPDSIGRFGRGALSFYHFSEAATSKLSETHFSAVDIANTIDRFYDDASQSLFFMKSLEEITALRRTEDFNIIPVWSVRSSHETILHGAQKDIIARNLTLHLTAPHTSDALPEDWLVTMTHAAEETFPPDLWPLSRRLLTPTFGLAVNLFAKRAIRNYRLFAHLPLPISTSLPVHIHATWILDQDRRPIRYDAPDATGTRPLEATYNEYILEKAIPPLYVKTLALVLAHHPNAAQRFWPGKAQDGPSQIITTELYKLITSTNEPVLLTVQKQPIAPSDAIIHLSNKVPPVVCKILSTLNVPNYVPTPYFDTTFREEWGSLRFDLAKEVSTILREHAIAIRHLWHPTSPTAPPLTLKDILSTLEYLVKGEESLDGIPLLLTGDRQLVEFRNSGHHKVFASHRIDIASLFGPTAVVDLEISDLTAQNLVNLNLNVATLDSQGMRDLLAHHSQAITPANTQNISDTQHQWYKDILKFLALPTCPVNLGDLADLPLLPALGRDLVVSLDYARSGRIWWRSPSENRALTVVLLQLDVISVDPLLGETQSTDVNEFTRIVQLFGELNLTASEILQKVAPKDWDAFVQYIKPWIQTPYLTGLSPAEVQTMTSLPVFQARQGTSWLAFVPASQVLVLPASVPLDPLARYLPPEGTFAASSPELAAVLERANDTNKNLSFSNLFSRLSIPDQLAQDEDDSFSSLLPLIATHHTGPYDSKLIPDGNRVLRRPSELFDHRVALFSTAFEGRQNLFVHPNFHHVIDSTVSLGVQREVTPQILLECIRAVDWDAQEGQDTIRRASWLWDYVNTAPPKLREITFETIRGLRFVPRHCQRHPSDPVFDDDARYLPSVVSLDKLCVPTREAVAWTQRARFAAPPSAHLTALYPSIGEPTSADVVQHLTTLVKDVAPHHPQSSILFSNIQSTYDWLKSNEDAAIMELSSSAKQPLWLNIDSDLDDWTCNWRFADELVFDLACDGGGQFAVRKLLLPYRSLLVGASADVYRVASPQPPKASEIRSTHPEMVRSGWDNLRKAGKLLDVCFKVQGQEIRAHRGMLAAMIPRFEAAFTESGESIVSADNTELPAYRLQEREAASAFAVQSVVDYVYTGTFSRSTCSTLEEANAALRDLLDLMELSSPRLWDVSQLANEAVQAVIELGLIRPDNYKDILARAEACDMTVLVDICRKTKEQNRWA
ncbi:hypothetical protein FRC04_010540 [Tulasnella sp. 424]|nr:hypothetical protein FRC04_010540 [Tulasnella sp. 424]